MSKPPCLFALAGLAAVVLIAMATSPSTGKSRNLSPAIVSVALSPCAVRKVSMQYK